MNPIEVLGALGWTYKSVFRRFFRGSLWIPFLLLLVVQAAGLFFLLSFHRPWAQSLAVPFLEWVGGEAALHYPLSYQVLPVAFARLQILIGVGFGSVVSAVATMRFARSFGELEGDGFWGRAWRRYPSVLLYSAVVSLLVFGAFWLQRLAPEQAMLTDAKVRWGVRLGTLGLAILIETLFVYTLAWMFLRSRSVFASMGASVRFLGRHFFPTLWLVAIPILIKYPLSWLSGRSDLFVNKFQPETVAMVLAVEVVAEMILSFIFVGTVTFYFLWRQQEEGRA